MVLRSAKEFLTVSRIVGIAFVALGLVGLSWSQGAEDWSAAWICFSLTFAAMAATTAPREDLLARLLADRSSVTLGRYLIEPLLGAGMCLLSLWGAAVVLRSFDVVTQSNGLKAAALLSGLLGVMFGVQVAGTAWLLRKK